MARQQKVGGILLFHSRSGANDHRNRVKGAAGREKMGIVNVLGTVRRIVTVLRPRVNTLPARKMVPDEYFRRWPVKRHFRTVLVFFPPSFIYFVAL